MEVKYSENGIYKIIPADTKSSEQIYDILEANLNKDENIFAKFSTAPGYYVWEWSGDKKDWNKLSEADVLIKDEVYDIIAQKRKLIESKLKDFSEELVDAIFKVPSDDWIFYRIDDNNSIEVKLAGWDYRFPAGGPDVGGSIKLKPAKEKQDVKLIIVEADRPVPNYKLSAKMLNGKFADKETDGQGTYPMKLPVGYECCIMSRNKEHDFSFVVEKDKYEYVFDITKPIDLRIYVQKDGLPANNHIVNVNYNGNDFTLCTNSEGIAKGELKYIKDATVNASVDNQTKSVQVQYPQTEMSFDIETPKAVIDITYKKNGSPVEDEKIVLDITGKGSVILTTDSNGKATYNTPYNDNVNVSVKVNSIERSQLLKMHTEFVIEENIVVPPPMPPEPDDGGDEISEEIVPRPYNIYVKTENGNPPQGSIILKQDGKEYNIPLDENGKCNVERNLIIPNKIVNATIDTKSGVFDEFKMEFEEDEDDYEIMLKLRRRSPFWQMLLEALVGVGVTFSLFIIYILFEGFFF